MKVVKINQVSIWRSWRKKSVRSQFTEVEEELEMGGIGLSLCMGLMNFSSEFSRIFSTVSFVESSTLSNCLIGFRKLSDLSRMTCCLFPTIDLKKNPAWTLARRSSWREREREITTYPSRSHSSGVAHAENNPWRWLEDQLALLVDRILSRFWKQTGN